LIHDIAREKRKENNRLPKFERVQQSDRVRPFDPPIFDRTGDRCFDISVIFFQNIQFYFIDHEKLQLHDIGQVTISRENVYD
jgi:hypothetical protein